jgi:hypothetical protein
VKFDFGDITKSVEKLQIWLKSDKNIGYFTLRPKYVCIVDSSTKYFVAHKQCKGNLLLHFRGNTEDFYIVNRYM